MATTNLLSRNNKSAKSLVIEQNSPIELKENPNNHKLFFTCGSIVGYPSPNAVKAFKEHKDISEFKFAEVSKDGVNYVPCLMVVGNGAPAIVSMGAELLH